MRKTNGLATWGGILHGVGIGLVGIPLLVLQAYAQIIKDGPPHWFNASILPMMLLGFILAMVGGVVVGAAAKGEDETPTVTQVEAATLKAVGDNLQQQAKDPAKDPNLGGK